MNSPDKGRSKLEDQVECDVCYKPIAISSMNQHMKTHIPWMKEEMREQQLQTNPKRKRSHSFEDQFLGQW